MLPQFPNNNLSVLGLGELSTFFTQLILPQSSKLSSRFKGKYLNQILQIGARILIVLKIHTHTHTHVGFDKSPCYVSRHLVCHWVSSPLLSFPPLPDIFQVSFWGGSLVTASLRIVTSNQEASLAMGFHMEVPPWGFSASAVICIGLLKVNHKSKWHTHIGEWCLGPSAVESIPLIAETEVK